MLIQALTETLLYQAATPDAAPETFSRDVFVTAPMGKRGTGSLGSLAGISQFGGH